MQIYPFKLAAAASLEIKCSGSFIKVLSLLSLPLIDSARLSVRTQQDEFPLAAGASADLGQTSKSWFLVNKTASAVSGEVVIGDGAYTDPSVAAAVAVIDTALSNVLGGRAYMATLSAGANGTQYLSLGLLNPAGSGKNMVIDALQLIGMEVANYGATRIKIGAGTGVSNVARNTLSIPKLAGGAAGSAYMFSERNSAVNYTQAGDSFLFEFWPPAFASAPGDTPLELVRGSPLVLPPGTVLQLSLGAPASVGLYANAIAHWRELPV